MAGVNKVILVGNLGADPEVRYLESGSKVATINVATSESYTNKSGERVEQTEWHRVELWDRLAEFCEQYLSKGRTVYIEGKIRTSTYQDKDGITRYDKRIRATNMTFVGGRNEGNDPQASSAPVQSQSKSASTTNSANNAPVALSTPEADNLPF